MMGPMAQKPFAAGLHDPDLFLKPLFGDDCQECVLYGEASRGMAPGPAADQQVGAALELNVFEVLFFFSSADRRGSFSPWIFSPCRYQDPSSPLSPFMYNLPEATKRENRVLSIGRL